MTTLNTFTYEIVSQRYPLKIKGAYKDLYWCFLGRWNKWEFILYSESWNKSYAEMMFNGHIKYETGGDTSTSSMAENESIALEAIIACLEDYEGNGDGKKEGRFTGSAEEFFG